MSLSSSMLVTRSIVRHRAMVSFAVLALANGAMPAAQAVTFTQVQADKSSLHFEYQQMGVKMQGRFAQWGAQLSFDPAKPEAAKGSFEVALASVDTGSAEGDGEVQGKPWFHASAFPKARFELKALKATGKQQYEATGQLMLKGQTRELRVPLLWTPASTPSQGTLKGGFVLKRGDFRIGEGPWAAFDIVANDVHVSFQLSLKP